MTGRILLAIGSVLLSLVLLEMGVRLARGPQWLARWSNLVLEDRLATRANTAGRLMHDPRLGFVPRPGFTSEAINYDHRGFRLTPAPPGIVLAEGPILVVGDSYAHGDEVADHETWAAQLQALVRRRVVNAASSGYGLDQIVLRAEAAAAAVQPAALVLGFIPDDLRRSEMKRVWGANKPYFELLDGALALRHVPVPPPPPPERTLTGAQWVFGHSLLVDFVLRHQGWQYEWAVDHERVLPRREGERLACPLLRRVAALGLPTLVVAEYDSWVWRNAEYARENRRQSNLVLDCATTAGLATLDMFAVMDATVRRQGWDSVYRSSHPGPAGTHLAATAIAAALEQRHMLAR